MFAYGETVVRLRRSTWEDPYSGGESLAPWDSEEHPPESAELEGWAFNPGGSSEVMGDGREIATTTPTAYGPIDADVKAGDRLVIRGVTYNVDGRPAEWRNPFTGWAPGMAVTLELVEG